MQGRRGRRELLEAMLVEASLTGASGWGLTGGVRYALICQDEGLMPIVEPDVVLAGDYDLETAVKVNVQVQACLFKAMLDHGVYMEGTTLKVSLPSSDLFCIANMCPLLEFRVSNKGGLMALLVHRRQQQQRIRDGRANQAHLPTIQVDH